MPERAGLSRSHGLGLEGRQAFEPLERALDGGAMDLEPFGELREAGLRRLAARVGHQPDDIRLLREAPVGLEGRDRIELAAGGADRALEVRRLGVEDAVELAAQGARDLARFDLEQGPRRPDPAQEGADRLPVLGGHHAPPATDAPRDGQPELGQPGGQLRRRGRLDDELEMGPPAGQAERATGEEPAAQPGGVAVFRRRSPGERRPGTPLPRPPETVREPGDGCLASGRCRAQAVDLGHAIAGARWVDGRQFVAECGDEIPLGPGHAAPPAAARRPATPAVTSGAPARGAAGRPAPDPGLALEGADDRGGEPGRLVVVGVAPGPRRRRG